MGRNGAELGVGGFLGAMGVPIPRACGTVRTRWELHARLGAEVRATHVFVRPISDR